jgi:ketosteroid isomerase-like protein
MRCGRLTVVIGRNTSCCFFIAWEEMKEQNLSTKRGDFLMTDRSELESAIHTFYRLRNENDIDGIMAWLDPHCCFRIVGNDQLGSLTQRINDRETMRLAIEAILENWDLSLMSVVDLHVDRDTIFVHRAGRIRFIPTDAVINTEILDKITFRAGLIIDFVEFVDTLLVADMTGLLKNDALHQIR